MQWKFWRNSGPRVLPEKVEKHLLSEFRLNDQATVGLRLLERRGRLAGRAVNYIRVYDPALVESGLSSPASYDDLQVKGYRQALLFEGHIEKQGQVYLYDRRGLGTGPKPSETAEATAQ